MHNNKQLTTYMGYNVRNVRIHFRTFLAIRGALNDPTSTIFLHSYPFTLLKIHPKYDNNAMMGFYKLTS